MGILNKIFGSGSNPAKENTKTLEMCVTIFNGVVFEFLSITRNNGSYYPPHQMYVIDAFCASVALNLVAELRPLNFDIRYMMVVYITNLNKNRFSQYKINEDYFEKNYTHPDEIIRKLIPKISSDWRKMSNDINYFQEVISQLIEDFLKEQDYVKRTQEKSSWSYFYVSAFIHPRKLLSDKEFNAIVDRYSFTLEYFDYIGMMQTIQANIKSKIGSSFKKLNK